jgi:ADP-ribose pyrophosphatase YjhB (NUDIX family)
LPGGFLEKYEQPADGLVREVVEETGLRIAVGTLLGAALFSPSQLDLLYEARVTGGQLQTTPEVRGWKWVSLTDQAFFLPNQLAMLRNAGELG